MRRLKGLASSSTQTPGEILYWWRHFPRRVVSLDPESPFPLPEERMAERLGLPVTTYRGMELGHVIPRPQEAREMMARVRSLPKKERETFLRACGVEVG